MSPVLIKAGVTRYSSDFIFFKGYVWIFCGIWILGCFLTFFWKFLSWVLSGFVLLTFSVPLFLWPLLVAPVFYLPALLCAFRLPLFFWFCSMCMMCIYLHVPLSPCATVFWGSSRYLFFTPFLVCFVSVFSCPCSFPPCFYYPYCACLCLPAVGI